VEKEGGGDRELASRVGGRVGAARRRRGVASTPDGGLAPAVVTALIIEVRVLGSGNVSLST
jgi:hypothetical protein